MRFDEGRSPSENILVSASRRHRVRNRAPAPSTTTPMPTHSAPLPPASLVANSAASSNLLNLLNERNITPTTRYSNRVIHPLPSRTARQPSPLEQKQEEDSQLNDDELRVMLGLPTANPPSPPAPESSLAAAGTSDTNGQTSEEGAIGLSSTKEQSIQEYTCPICFCPPTRACLTPCGHVMCATCLFSAVKAAKQSQIRAHAARTAESRKANCPVCRAEITGWDGRGGGVFGLSIALKKETKLAK